MADEELKIILKDPTGADCEYPYKEKLRVRLSDGTKKVYATEDSGDISADELIEVLCSSSPTKAVEIVCNAEYLRNNCFYQCDGISGVDLPFCKYMPSFYGCDNLKYVKAPLATVIGTQAFYYDKALESIYAPNVTTIGEQAFEYNSSLKDINFPAVKTIGEQAFRDCNALEKVDLGAAETISSQAFYECDNLKAVILRGDAVVTLENYNAFGNGPVYYTSGAGYVYVPKTLLDSYKAADIWSTSYANKNKIRAIEDYPDICG